MKSKVAVKFWRLCLLEIPSWLPRASSKDVVNRRLLLSSHFARICFTVSSSSSLIPLCFGHMKKYWYSSSMPRLHSHAPDWAKPIRYWWAVQCSWPHLRCHVCLELREYYENCLCNIFFCIVMATNGKSSSYRAIDWFGLQARSQLLITGGGRFFPQILDLFQGLKNGLPSGCLGETSIF